MTYTDRRFWDFLFELSGGGILISFDPSYDQNAYSHRLANSGVIVPCPPFVNALPAYIGSDITPSKPVNEPDYGDSLYYHPNALSTSPAIGSA